MATEHLPSRAPWVGRVAAVALIGLVAGGSVASAIHVQNRLTSQAQAVLDNAGIPADVKYSGLDAEISGFASDEELARGVLLVSKVTGTRNVTVASSDVEQTGPELDPSVAPTTTVPTTAQPTTASPSATPTPTKTTPLPDVDIYFAGSSATISASQTAKLQQVASWMKSNPTGRVEVRGHTDNGLTASGREELSRQRAQVVVVALGELGISGERFVIRALGSNASAADNETKEGRAKNRRVDFAVVRS